MEVEKLVLPACLAASLAINAVFGRNIGEVSRRFPTPFTPKDPAFTIWAAIYTALAALCVFQWKTTTVPHHILLGSSLIASSLWIVLFTQVTFKLPAAVALTATLALCLPTYILMKTPVQRALLALYVGWVCVATLIGWAILAPSWPMWLKIAGWMVALVALSTLSIYKRDPVVILPLIWATAWVGSTESFVALVLASLSALFSAALFFAPN